MRRDVLAARKKIRASLARGPDDQAYLRVPSIPSVAWQPYPSPPRDGQEPIALRPRLTTGLPLSRTALDIAFRVIGVLVVAPVYTQNLRQLFGECKRPRRNFFADCAG